MTGRQRVFLGTELLAPGQGGIAVVARMTARALINAGFDVELHSLLDDTPLKIADKQTTITHANRITYAARCHTAALSHDHFIYDSVGTARAHPRFWPLKQPYAVWIHGVEVWNNLHKDRERALRNANLVLVNSNYTRKRFEETHRSLKNAHVCHLATEENKPPSERADFSGPQSVLILGRIEQGESYKGHKELIDCWPQVTAQLPDAQLVIAGGGSGLPQIRQYAAASPVADKIKLKGFVPHDELPNLWRQAHLFAMPSRAEGFGIVYAQAMRHGLPVIASIHDAGSEVNINGETGINVNLDKPSELPKQIISLLRFPKKLQTMGKNGFKHWQKHFRYGAFADRLHKSLGPFLSKPQQHISSQSQECFYAKSK